jgi:nucleotide-binding universal stress UspA family protein
MSQAPPPIGSTARVLLAGLGAEAPPAFAVTRAARLARALGARLAVHPVHRGDFVHEVAIRSVELGACVVVVTADGSRLGSRVTGLVQASGRPVLVARDAETDDCIIAATDLESIEFPVLSDASALAQLLASRVVAVHNLTPISVILGGGLSCPVSIPPDEREIAERGRLLMRATRGVTTCEAVVVRHEHDSAAAILEEARSREADLIVVGSRRRTWAGRMIAGNVTERVVNRARRSVLVTPLDAVRG